MTEASRISHPLARARAEAGDIGYEELSRLTGLDKGNLWNAEHGTKRFTVRTAIHVEAALGLAPYSLVRWADDLTANLRSALMSADPGLFRRLILSLFPARTPLDPSRPAHRTPLPVTVAA